MLDVDAEQIRGMVKKAQKWVPDDNEYFLDSLRESVSKKQPPEVVRKCCWHCAFMNLTDDTCENFQLPRIMGIFIKKYPNLLECIPIPRKIASSIYCEAWIDRELVKLLLGGYVPGAIAYGRRHPKLEIPPNGLGIFSKWLDSLSNTRSNKKGE